MCECVQGGSEGARIFVPFPSSVLSRFVDISRMAGD